MAEAGAVIHVIGAKAGPHELLEQVVLLIRAAGRGQPRHRIRPVRLYHLGQPGGNNVERRLPGDGHEVRRTEDRGPFGVLWLLSAVLQQCSSYQRLGEPVGVA